MASSRLLAVSLLAFAFGFGCSKKEPEPAASAPETPAPTASQAAAEAEKAAAEAAVARAVASSQAAAAQVSANAAAPAPGDIPAPPDVAAPPKEAKKTASGLAFRVLKPGTGKDKPGDADRVKVHYSGWTKDGKMFDSSVKRGEPATFGVGQVIPGWTEALKLMVVGEQRRLWIPAALAYGVKPQPGMPAGDLTFDVSLLEIMPGPKVPEDVKAPPASAKKTASGLRYRVLKPGTGKVHPKATDTVTVHYSGFTPDGKMFDSSVQRGEPATFSLGQVIKGWTEGVQLMVEGERTRFWIPADLAYGEKAARPGTPSGPLVFDVELLQIR
jgi:FKBP-type peptidyl-prolyl cis-trans isomerase